MATPPACDSPNGTGVGPAVNWQAALAEHNHWLRTVVYSRLRDLEAVGEVMQEVSLAAVRQAAPLSDPSKVAPWLYRLAVRQALLYRRACGRRRKLTERYAEQLRPDGQDTHEPEPLQWLLADERRRIVRAAIARLAPRDAEILLLKYTENWSYHQLAAHLGVSHSAVESRLHRARGRLRDQLTVRGVVETRR